MDDMGVGLPSATGRIPLLVGVLFWNRILTCFSQTGTASPIRDRNIAKPSGNKQVKRRGRGSYLERTP